MSEEAEPAAQLAAFDADQAWAVPGRTSPRCWPGSRTRPSGRATARAKQVKTAIAAAKADLAATDEAADRLEQLREDLPALDGQIVELALLAEGFAADAAGHRATAKAAAAQVRRLTVKVGQAARGRRPTSAHDGNGSRPSSPPSAGCSRPWPTSPHSRQPQRWPSRECETAYARSWFRHDR